MDLERNVSGGTTGKYAIVKLKEIEGYTRGFARRATDVAAAIVVNPGVLQFGKVDTGEEFFVLKLKDKYALAALRAYAEAAMFDDPEYARQINELADRAGSNSPFCKKPD